MISKATIQRIYDEVEITDVVGDFVNLRRRGSNLIGLCPFHNEKTPSFSVSPARNIYKCFGCGKGGDSVNFIMEHEHYTYPEALRYLAKKLNITIEETEPDPAEKQADDERESLFTANAFAGKFFTEQLTQTEEGKAIGLSYFAERGFEKATIEKFQLGYSPQLRNALAQQATASQFSIELLEKAGLVIQKDQNTFDRFWGRVIFPIHNLTGRIIAFGGRILKTDAHAAKYINSPETDIYSKSKILYGIYFARKAIVQNDLCFLCEGYTDVISMHQCGIENAVASSGTSLTTDQIKLIKRYTKNITVLYDGDPAGIKASMRGIDMILAEGMNVRVVLFPDGHDPDSYSKTISNSEFAAFLNSESKDFIVFKTSLLLKEVKDDPIGKSKLIREIIETIAIVPDAITRSTYTRHCAALLEVEEQILITEINKIRRSEYRKLNQEESVPDENPTPAPQPELIEEEGLYHQEKELIRLLLNFSDETFSARPRDFVEGQEEVLYVVKEFMKEELIAQNIKFENELFAEIFASFDEKSPDTKLELSYFLNHENEAIRNLVSELISLKYSVSERWADKGIDVPAFDQEIKHGVMSAVFRMKEKTYNKMKTELLERLKHIDVSLDDEIKKVLDLKMKLDDLTRELNNFFGTVISG